MLCSAIYRVRLKDGPPGCLNAAGKARQKRYARAGTKITEPGDRLLGKPLICILEVNPCLHWYLLPLRSVTVDCPPTTQVPLPRHDAPHPGLHAGGDLDGVDRGYRVHHRLPPPRRHPRERHQQLLLHQGCNSIDILVGPESGPEPCPSHVWILRHI